MNPSLSNTYFPWEFHHFPRCIYCAVVSLLSKKGLRYLLYPFISLWMVGGRISPSFTSALSNELSNNLGTKTEKEKKEKNSNKNYLSSCCAFARWIPAHYQLPIHRICRVSIEFYSKSYKPCWVKEKIKMATWNWTTEGKRKKICFASFN